MIALDAIDRVIATISKSEDKDDAHATLMKTFQIERPAGDGDLGDAAPDARGA